MSLNPHSMTSDPAWQPHIVGEEEDGILDPDLADPHRLLIPARDAAGETDTLTAKLQPLYVESLRAIARDPRWPWRDAQAVLRWIIHHGIQKIEAARPPEHSFMWMIDSMNEILRRNEYHEIYESYFTKLDEQARWMAVEDPSGEGMRRSVRDFHARILSGPREGDDGWWRDRALEKLVTQYGMYL